MPENNLLNQYEQIPKIPEKVENFFQKFENAQFTTSEGKLVTMHSRGQSRRTDYSEDIKPYLFEFEGYPGENTERKNVPTKIDRLAARVFGKKEENYILLRAREDRRIIDIVMVMLQNQDLKGKGIFFAFTKMVAENLPEGFTVVSRVENEKARKKILEISHELREKNIDQAEAERLLFRTGTVQSAVKAGFNNIRLILDTSFDLFGEAIFLHCGKEKSEGVKFSVEVYKGSKGS